MRPIGPLLVTLALGGCASTADLGLLQRGPGDGTGGSLGAHLGVGAVEHQVAVVSVDVRGDVATSGSRFAFGASLLGGLPIGRWHVLGRAGVWHAVASNTAERALVPTFELAGYAPLRGNARDPAHPQYGMGTAGIIFGVREDLDLAAYTTVFVGLALFFVPGY